MTLAQFEQTTGRGGERLDGLPDEVVGNDLEVPVVGGRARYAFLDNAASTPALRAAQRAVDDFLPWYSSVHRGAGYKSRVATTAFELARERVRSFVNADEDHAVTFVKNTTEGLNRLGRVFGARNATVITSPMEHHANLLPWRVRGCTVRLVPADQSGVIDEEALRIELEDAPVGPCLVAIAGAYNVSGYAPPIHRIARLAHQYGAQMLVDGAQLVPHRRVDMRGRHPDERIDFLIFSSHKVYAPFGSGALIAARADMERAEPDLVGGGVADMVSEDEVVWNALPDREEAGSPNVVGAVALGVALARMEELGRDALEAQELALTAYMLDRLTAIPGFRLLGPLAGPDRVGVVSFTLGDIPHRQVAAALSYEYGIGVRNGWLCAQPGVLHLLGTPPHEVEAVRSRLRRGDHSSDPGVVRVSLGLQNTRAEVDRLAEGLERIAAGSFAACYRQDRETGDYVPEGWSDDAEARARTLTRTT